MATKTLSRIAAITGSLGSLLLACNHGPVEKTGAASAASTDLIVARVAGQPITLAELDKTAAGDLYEARKNALESLVTDRALEVPAKQAGKSPDDYLHGIVEQKVPDVTETEAREFFGSNKERLGPQFEDKKFDDVKDVIVKGLTAQKRREALGPILADIREKAGVQILLTPPRIEVAAVGPARGAATATVTIVEFSDFQCPYCAKGREVMDRVMKEYDGKVRLVFRDFPLPFHDHAEKASEAAQCANDQGKFWELHDWMFDHQAALSVPELEQQAKSLGLDGVKFGQCLTSGKYAKYVEDNVHAGQKAGVKGTPAFFVNGAFLSGALPFEEFKKSIDAELARK